MNKQEASLLLMNKVIIQSKERTPLHNVNMRHVATFNINLMALGFSLSPEVMNSCIANFTKEEFEEWSSELQDILIKYNGSRQNMKPMYPGFPKQVMEASDLELYLNALIHYASQGTWIPEYEEKIKLRSKSILKPLIINLAIDEDLVEYINKLAESPIAMSSQQKIVFDFLIEEYGIHKYCSELQIPNKENMAFIIHCIAKKDFKDTNNTWHRLLAHCNMSTITDILRLTVVYLGGDPSLSERCSFKSIKRSDRRFLLNLIDELYKQRPEQVEEDASRYQGLWVIVLEQLHPGDYKNKYTYAYKFATKVRENKLKTWYAKLENAYDKNDLNKVIKLLKSRPGEFARHLERTIRFAIKLNENNSNVTTVINEFETVANKVDRTILLQLQAYFNKCKNLWLCSNFEHLFKKDIETDRIRTFFPKGNVSKVFVIKDTREPLDYALALRCKLICCSALIDQYKEKEKLDKVYIDPNIVNYTVPLKLRNASNQLKTVSRGSRMKLPNDANIIRLYTWWQNLTKGSSNWKDRIDIDLSATFYDENFNKPVHDVYYGNLRVNGVVHSGDIVNAPNGASEFINIDIETLLKQNIRYVAMNIHSFNEETFNIIPECFAGVMVLDEIKDTEQTFDPAKSLIRSDISTEATSCIPMVFDLETREVIWIDSIIPRHSSGSNDVAHCKDSITNVVRGIVSASYPTLGKLIEMNIIARNGKRVNTKEEADIIFSLDEGITPYDLEILNSEWV